MPLPDNILRFSSSSTAEQGSFKLLELSPELAKIVEGSLETSEFEQVSKHLPASRLSPHSLNVAFTSRDDLAKTRYYAPRTKLLRFELSLEGYGTDLTIRDQLNEILELTQTIPKLQILNTLLKGKEYGEDEEDREEIEDEGSVTYADAQALIQASEVELQRGLRDRRILYINEYLRPIASAYLTKVIQVILNTLAALSLDHEAVSVEKLSAVLTDEHDVPRVVSVQVMGWLGEINELTGEWKMDVEAIVREAGLGLLKESKNEPLGEEDLLQSWRELVGDKLSSSVALNLLAGNYLHVAGPYHTRQVVKYFPVATLPVDHAQRFADLFLARSRWKREDINPFISDIAVDWKERDKLLLKYARATTDAQGIWYTARVQYNG
ncbi:hypothetical protein D9757_002722 [Collybiopsis confluens]|uniref:Sister chromatid cohesion protein DCC1 n=1 Tax=Collybiopsis confluens TaxID=2823264 RepID=A0A8H5ME60_9AGAR|nr:hypothetical protein D9757_002722 [Collybiopsis confluens]